jgi:hypothetical protein
MSEAPNATQTPSPPAPVDGQAVLCPLCNYDLRGLIEARCPECGYQFVWTELLDEQQRTHPYLFEHHSRRSDWSFVRTAIGGLNPLRFWQTLRPQMRTKPARLLWYWVVCTSFPALLAAILFAARRAADQMYPPFVPWVAIGGRLVPNGAAPPPKPYFVDLINELSILTEPFLLASVFIAIWAVSTFAALLVFQQSMLKARIRQVQVARCVAYSFDVGLWCAMAGALLAVLASISGVRGAPFEMMTAYFFMFCCAFFALAATRLWFAYRLYLAFDHAFWVVISSQIIAALTLVTLLLNIKFPP